LGCLCSDYGDDFGVVWSVGGRVVGNGVCLADRKNCTDRGTAIIYMHGIIAPPNTVALRLIEHWLMETACIEIEREVFFVFSLQPKCANKFFFE